VSRFYIVVKLLDPDSCEDKKGVNFGKWCKKYQDHGGMMNIKKIIKSLTVVHDFLPRLNQQLAFIPIQNGLVVDLRTGDTRARTADDLFTMEMNFSLLEVAEVANFMMEFAKDCPDTYQYCHELYGYCLGGWIFDRAFYLMLGNGANGKGTVSAALQKVIGDFFQVAPSSFLTKKANAKTGAEAASPQFYKMRFARVLMASELSKNEVLDFAKIKGLSAGDPFSVRPLYREPETVVPRFKVVVQSNFSPDIDGSDLAIIDRYRLVMFRQRYANNPQAGELKKDVNRVERFLSLTDAFGTWMVQGARLMFARGGGTEVVVPDSIQHTTTKQLEQANLMGVFLRLECEVAMGEVDEADLFQEYCGFASKRRHNDQGISFTEFQEKLMSFSNMGFQRAGAIIVGLRMKRYVAPAVPAVPVTPFVPVATITDASTACLDCINYETPCVLCRDDLKLYPKCKGCARADRGVLMFGFCAKCREPLPM
jgi:P4 family phage/plasmid primase-like protien